MREDCSPRNNSHLVSLIPDLKRPEYPEGIECELNIGFYIRSKSRYTLATLGRNGAHLGHFITMDGGRLLLRYHGLRQASIS